MADIVSAGGFVAAVLEQAGYMTQARYLQEFKAFFREAGALIYILAAAGALFSMTMFGSFRAARYLLLGPAIYWFLLGPTAEFQGVSWRPAGGAPRDVHREIVDERKSSDSVNEAVEDAGLGESSGSIKVAYVFSFFVKLINSVVRDLGYEITNHDDKEYRHTISKARALDYLMMAEPEDPLFTQMVEQNLMGDCFRMFGGAMEGSAYELTADGVRDHGGGDQVLRTRREAALKRFNDGAESDYVQLGTQRSAALSAYIEESQQGALQAEKIKCGDLYKYVATYLHNYAKYRVAPQVLKLAKGDGADIDNACERVMEKVVETGAAVGGGSCENDLVNIAAIYLLKNSVARRNPLARSAQWAINDSEPAGSTKTGGFMPSGSIGGKTRGFVQLEGAPGVDSVDTNEGGPFMLNQLYPYLSGASPRQSFQYTAPLSGGKNAAKQERQWSPHAKFTAIGGAGDAAFTELPRYNIVNMKQQLFNWAMLVPYWQGVILYLIAVAYPFIALVVLIPGRAMSFLLLPLAWLWVKSWDVGFACVLVFERVLWNVFPSVQIPERMSKTILPELSLMDVLAETQKYDDIWNLHSYYLLLSMGTLSVPAIMGMAILKSKRSILSSFTDKMVQDAKDSGGAAAAGYQIQVAADRSRVMQDIRSVAADSVTSMAEGIAGSQRFERALAFGGGRAAAELIKNGAAIEGSSALSIGSKALGASLSAAATAVDVTADMLVAETKFDRAQKLAFDRKLGRFGLLQMYNDAYAAAMDASGGFESQFYNDQINSVEEFTSLFVAKAKQVSEMVADTGKAGFNWSRRAGLTYPFMAIMMRRALATYFEGDDLDKLQAEYDKAMEEGVEAMMRFGHKLEAEHGITLYNQTFNFVPTSQSYYQLFQNSSEEERAASNLGSYDKLLESVNPYTPEYVRSWRFPEEFSKLNPPPVNSPGANTVIGYYIRTPEEQAEEEAKYSKTNPLEGYTIFGPRTEAEAPAVTQEEQTPSVPPQPSLEAATPPQIGNQRQGQFELFEAPSSEDIRRQLEEIDK